MNQDVLHKAQSEIFPRQIFRAYDIRGNIQYLTEDLVREIGFALGAVYQAAGQSSVVVGYDARLSSQVYSHVLVDALMHSGLDVIEIGCVSSPLLYFSAKLHQGNGVMITASHNPVSDNGIKWLINHLPPTPSQIQNIADRIETAQYHLESPQGKIQQQNYFSQYLAYLKTDIQLCPNMKVSIDGLHGSAGEIAQKVLLALGCQVYALNCTANGHFPLGAPDPSDTERLLQLQKSVQAEHSVMGIALDGDGDRLVLIDDQAKPVSPDRIMSLLSKMCLLNHPHAEIVGDVKCSSLIVHTVQRYAGRFSMIRTGSSFLRRYLYQHHALFGGEFAGHYVFNDGRGQGYDDGLYAALRILEYLSASKQSLSQALAEFPERLATKDIYISTSNVDYLHVQHAIESSIQAKNSNDQVIISKVDGIRLDFPFGFGIIRPSNTGEFFTVRFDADSEQHLALIRQTFIDALQAEYLEIAHAIAIAN